jgi:hypothetical protein
MSIIHAPPILRLVRHSGVRCSSSYSWLLQENGDDERHGRTGGLFIIIAGARPRGRFFCEDDTHRQSSQQEPHGEKGFFPLQQPHYGTLSPYRRRRHECSSTDDITIVAQLLPEAIVSSVLVLASISADRPTVVTTRQHNNVRWPKEKRRRCVQPVDQDSTKNSIGHVHAHKQRLDYGNSMIDGQ